MAQSVCCKVNESTDVYKLTILQFIESCEFSVRTIVKHYQIKALNDTLA